MLEVKNSFETLSVYAGIIVGRKWIEMKLTSCEHIAQVPNTAQGAAEIIAALHIEMPTLIALEASGGLEVRLGVELIAAGFTVLIADPRQVRDYALTRNLGKWGESGSASALASFALALSHKRPRIKVEDAQALQEMLARHRQLVDIRNQESLRLENATMTQRRSLMHHLAWLEKCLGELDVDMLRRLRASDAWRVRENLLRSMGENNVVRFPACLRTPGPRLDRVS